MERIPRWYQRLFRLYPSSFEAEAGRELREMAAAEWARAITGPARVRVSLRLAADHLGTLAGAWLGVLLGGRERRRAGWFETVGRETRIAWRGLIRTPVFFAIAVVIIGLGIGATTAILSIGNAVLLRAPAGVRNPGELVTVHARGQDGSSFHSFSVPAFRDLVAAGVPGLTLAAYGGYPVTLADGDEAKVSAGLGVSGDYFTVLGVRPLLGRLLGAADDAGIGGPQVVVLSHAFWRDRMAADSSIVGRSITLNGEAFQVVGVAEPGFRGQTAGFDLSVWVPIAFSLAPSRRGSLDSRHQSWLEIVGRSVAVDRAVVEERLSVVAARAGREAGLDWDRRVEVLAYSPVPGAAFLPLLGFVSLLLLLGAMILLISSTNIAGVMAARAAARTREIAVRLAIGAHRTQVIRQLVIENVLLFLVGGGVGIVLAWAAVRTLAGVQLPLPVPVVLEFPLDARVLAVALTVSLAAGLCFGLAPALRVSRPQLTSSLKDDGSVAGPARFRFRSVLVGAQVAGSALLLVMAGLLVRALGRVGQIDVGFEPNGIRVVEFDFKVLDYDSTRIRAFVDQMSARLGALPGVSAVGAIDLIPLALSNQESVVAVPGRERVEGVGFFPVDFAIVTPGYFGTMRLPIVRGRGFSDGDRAGAPRVIVVNEKLAAELWPGQDPLGRTIEWGSTEGGDPVTVVGIAANSMYRSIGEDRRSAVYLPVGQDAPRALSFVIRENRRDPGRPAAIRAIARELDRNLPVVTNASYQTILGLGLLPNRVAAALASAFGVVGLLLATVGLYGVLSYLVLRRRREMGIRLALGAASSSLRRMVLWDGLRLAGAGLVLGVVAALVVVRAARSLFFGLEATDPVTVGGAALVLLGAAALASDLPARRAAATEPAEVLRDE